jgi:uncharacterized membrane protein YoaK (UPF0700 family)
VAADRRSGPLPALLIGLTVVTGLVDTFSYLSLAHVFVANVTGSVFLGFAMAGVGEIKVLASLSAVLSFALGAVWGGRWATARRPHRGGLPAAATAIQAGLVVAAAVVWHPRVLIRTSAIARVYLAER